MKFQNFPDHLSSFTTKVKHEGNLQAAPSTSSRASSAVQLFSASFSFATTQPTAVFKTSTFASLTQLNRNSPNEHLQSFSEFDPKDLSTSNPLPAHSPPPINFPSKFTNGMNLPLHFCSQLN
jgi:hypothetical protein